jgi:hypothetical protein
MGIAALPLAFAAGQGLKVAALALAVVVRIRRIGNGGGHAGPGAAPGLAAHHDQPS